MTERILMNNISVIYEPIYNQPFCGIEIWFHFGAASDPIGLSGMAHLLEHLLYSSLDEIDPYLCYNRSASTSKDRIRLGGVFGDRHAVDIVKKIFENILEFNIGEYQFAFQKEKVLYEIKHLQKAPILEFIDFFEGTVFDSRYGYEKSTFGSVDGVESIECRFAQQYWKDNLCNGITISLTGSINIEKVYYYIEEIIKYKFNIGKSDIFSIKKNCLFVDSHYGGKMFVYDVGNINKLDVLTTMSYLLFSLRNYPIAVKNIEYKKCRAICVYISDDKECFAKFNNIIDGSDGERLFKDICGYQIDCFNNILHTPMALAKYNLENVYFDDEASAAILLNKMFNLSVEQVLKSIKKIMFEPKVIISANKL